MDAQDLEYMCNVFVNTKRLEDALQALKELIEIDPLFDANRRLIFQVIYKKMADSMRESLRILSMYLQAEKKQGHIELVRALENKMESVTHQLISICKEGIETMETVLIPAAEGSPESTAFFIKFKADLYRYISEFSDETESLSALDQAEKLYQQAIDICASNLSKNHPYYLSSILNASVFQYEQRKNLAAAQEMCNSAIDQFDQNATDIDQNQLDESRQLVDLMSKNLFSWANMVPEDEDEQ
ncbi:14-3-3 protein [Trichomonas vaginalis G3]|uniref:14-3-3 protein n=1 Tax=Trichomonas vaginalis (strain ATCC PRA-98 / G3) TaxID=412133 RepID=A2EJB7_TRIV3|nr:protein domain specific binding [Trichomonas vaginalis G3]EAY07269.1 14-3-3 protein [Trichomonas vaginalis G3]KAI5511959.1 protein domain specific binding [Trichomonas vaginalis G3]|eukprot:XP_001319492.1 14-3-3 protein [Trichomonas vaginalis G3]